MTQSSNAILMRSVAAIRSISGQDLGRSVKLPHAEAPVLRDLRNGLCVAYLVDEGDHFAYVQNAQLADSQFTLEGLHECALNNLAQRARGRASIREHGPVSAVLLDGNFEASLILLDHLWDETLAHRAPTGFVVALPARDVLAFCDAASQEGIEALKGVVQRVFAGGSHLLSQSLYRRREGKWEPTP
jgi:uncharacterized protein YtpQ (UPF0354 family)